MVPFLSLFTPHYPVVVVKSAVSLFLAAALSAGPGASAPSTPGVSRSAETASFTIRKRVEETHLSFSVKDRHGNAVAGLKAADLLVVEDGLPVKDITSFYRYDDLPLRVVVMLDTSDSMRDGFATERRMAESMLGRMVRSSADEVSIVSFSATSQTTQSGERGSVLTEVRKLRPAGQTALYDTLCKSVQALIDRPEITPVRRAIVLFSDGEDDWSRHNLLDVIALAQQAEVPVYAISVHSRKLEFPGDPIMRRLAEATGGRAFFPGNYDHFEKIYQAIHSDLRAHYVIGFRPDERAKLPGYHTLKLAIPERKVEIRARTGYYVP
jgi:Ca-activated chloride channel family protein